MTQNSTKYNALEILPEGTVLRLVHSPTQINSSVRLSVRNISFNYSAENLLIPTIKATIETSWFDVTQPNHD